MRAFLFFKDIIVNVKLAGWDSDVSRTRMSASLVPAKMVAPVWTGTMVTLVSAKLGLEVIIIISPA